MNMKQTVLIPALTLLFTACGVDNNKMNQAHVETVSIAETPVQNQGRVGFCWAYGEMAFIESQYKVQTGKTVNLSEEALGMLRIAHALHKIFVTTHGAELYSSLAFDKIPEGWNMRLTSYDRDSTETEDDQDGLDLAKRYGVWPESVWNFKIPNGAAKTELFRAISNRARALVNSYNPQTLTVEEVIEKVLVGTPGIPSRPPIRFSVDGQEFTPQEYLKFLKFDPDNFAAVEAHGDQDFAKIVNATKLALLRGISVPMGFPINIERLKGDTFSGIGFNIKTESDVLDFARDGGHLMLVTDFVNVGSTVNALTFPEIQKEFFKSENDLDYFFAKNSWGLGAKTNEAGIRLGGSENGYYKIDKNYLINAAKVGQFPKRPALEIIVPNDIAQNPFAMPPH